MEQKYTSKDTSMSLINKVYKICQFKDNSNILDYGGGRYDRNIEYMKEKNDSNVRIFDKYNRSNEHNKNVIDFFKTNIPDYIVCSNVLNVIMENEIIDEICKNITELADNSTIIYFAIYECDKSGIGKVTSKGYQRNELTKEYIKFIEKYLKVVNIKSGIITCRKE